MDIVYIKNGYMVVNYNWWYALQLAVLQMFSILRPVNSTYSYSGISERNPFSPFLFGRQSPGGEGSVLPSTNSTPDAGTPEGPGPGGRAQRSGVFYPLSGLLKRVHWSDREVPQAAS